eukprot:403375800
MPLKDGSNVQIILKQKDLRDLGYQIGIDYDKDKERYGWILDLMINSELPPGVEKERDYEGQLEDTQEYNNPTQKEGKEYLEYLNKKLKKQEQNEQTKNDIKQIKVQSYTSRKQSQDDQILMKVTDKNILEKVKKIQKRFVAVEHDQNPLHEEKYQEQAILEVTSFYMRTFGLMVNKIKQLIGKFMNSPDFSMQYVIDLANHYGLDLKQEPHLLWIPRVLINIPLPHNWKRISEDTYQSILEPELSLNFHPAEPFIRLFIQKARSFYRNNPEKVKDMPALQLYDSIMRQHNLNSMTLAVQQKKENFDEQVFSFMERAYQQRTKKVTYDIEIMEVAKQCEIDLIQEIHLLKVIEDVLNENKQQGLKWEYREVRSIGIEYKPKKYWINVDTKRTQKIYPLLRLVKEKINVVRSLNEKYKNEIQKNHINRPTDISPIFDGNTGQQLFDYCLTERQQASDQMFRNLLIKENPQLYDADTYQDYNSDLHDGDEAQISNSFYSNLKEVLENTIHKRINKDELLDILFYNPFKLLENANMLSEIQIPDKAQVQSANQFNHSSQSKRQKSGQSGNQLIRNILEVRKQESHKQRENEKKEVKNQNILISKVSDVITDSQINTPRSSNQKIIKKQRQQRSWRDLFQSPNVEDNQSKQFENEILNEVKNNRQIMKFATLNQKDIQDIMNCKSDTQKDLKINQFFKNNQDMDPNAIEKLLKVFKTTKLAKDFISILRNQKKQELLDKDQYMQDSLTKQMRQKSMEEEEKRKESMIQRNISDMPNLKNIILTMGGRAKNDLEPQQFSPKGGNGLIRQGLRLFDNISQGNQQTQNKLENLQITSLPLNEQSEIDVNSIRRLSAIFGTQSLLEMQQIIKKDQYDKDNLDEETIKLIDFFKTISPFKLSNKKRNSSNSNLESVMGNGEESNKRGLRISISKFPEHLINAEQVISSPDEKQEFLSSRYFSSLGDESDFNTLRMPKVFINSSRNIQQNPDSTIKSRNQKLKSQRQVCLTHRVFIGDAETKKLEYKQNLSKKYLEKIQLLRRQQLDQILIGVEKKQIESIQEFQKEQNTQDYKILNSKRAQDNFSTFYSCQERGSQTNLNIDPQIRNIKFTLSPQNNMLQPRLNKRAFDNFKTYDSVKIIKKDKNTNAFDGTMSLISQMQPATTYSDNIKNINKLKFIKRSSIDDSDKVKCQKFQLETQQFKSKHNKICQLIVNLQMT